MARLHPVLRLHELGRAVARVRGQIVLEEKIDGVLVIVYRGRLYSGSGGKPPAYIISALRDEGLLENLAEASSETILYIEVFSENPPAWIPCRNCSRRFSFYLVDAAKPPRSMDIEQTVFRAKTLELEKRLELAEQLGLENPRIAYTECMSLECVVEETKKALNTIGSHEGVVVKLYSSYGHILRGAFVARGVAEAKLHKTQINL